MVLYLLGLPLFPPPPCCPQCSKQPLGNRSHRSGRAGEWGGSSIGQSSQPSRWSFLSCQHTCLTARVQQGQAPLWLSRRKGSRGQGVGLETGSASRRAWPLVGSGGPAGEWRWGLNERGDLGSWRRWPSLAFPAPGRSVPDPCCHAWFPLRYLSGGFEAGGCGEAVSWEVRGSLDWPWAEQMDGWIPQTRFLWPSRASGQCFPGPSGDYREGAAGVSWKTHPSVPCLLSESPGGAAAGSLGLAVIP